MGGRPVRSKLRRRSSCAREASGEGRRPAFSTPARMKASTAFRPQRRVASGGRRRSHRRDIGPVRLPLGAFRDPAPQRRDLIGREPRAPALGEGHPPLLVRVEQAGDERALVRRTGDHRHRARGERALGDLFAVEPQAGLAGGLVRTVAREAVLGQDRPHVAVVAEVARIARPRGRPRRQHRRPRLGHLDRDAFRPGRAGRDPAPDRLDLSRVERRCFLRHPVLRIGARDLLVEQASRGIARDHDLAGVAAFAEERLAVEPQQRLALARAVAADARRREDRQHLAHEVRRRLGCRGDSRRDSAAERERGRERHDERNRKPGAAPHGQKEILSLLLARRRTPSVAARRGSVQFAPRVKRSKRGLPRSGANVGSLRSHAGER